MPKRDNNFDLIRLLAAMQVVFVHAVGHTQLLETGPKWLVGALDWIVLFPGVAVFFVISGFLIARSYERLRGRPKIYLWHRVLRIYPALLVCFGVSLAILAGLGFLTADVVGSGTFWAWLTGQVTFGQFYNPEFFRSFGLGVVNGALWTISVEFQFYLAIPLVYALVFPRDRPGVWQRMLLPASFLASFFVFWFVDLSINRPGGFTGAGMQAKLLFITLFPHWWMFVLGIWIHRNFGRLRGLLENRLPWHLGAYLTLAAVREFAIGRDGSLSWLFYLGYLPERILLATLTISAAYTARGLSRKLLGGVDISYGIYIYHYLAINVFIELGGMNSAWWVLAVFAITSAAALASWFGIEKRALSHKHMFDNWHTGKRRPLPEIRVNSDPAMPTGRR